jgi:hypothetical protein
MATDLPLNSVTLGASSVADDLGYVALYNLAQALDGVTSDYRVIGGHMVTMLAARWQLGAGLYRETGDVDLGIPPIVARDHQIAGRLRNIGYVQVAGNRFARELADIPAGLAVKDCENVPQALIDVLVPAYSGRPRENVQVADDLFSTEVPGLHLALARPPVSIALELRRLNGQALHCELPFADEVSALVLKAFATNVRVKDTDIGDIWRCLEIANAAGLGPADFHRGTPAEAAAVVRRLFGSRHGPAMRGLASQQHLSPEGADQRHTRILALMARVLAA